MKTLTKEQANRLRAVRKEVYAVAQAVKALTMALCDACGHVREDDPLCPVCGIYRPFASADKVLHDIGEDLDAHLSRGPDPSAK